MDIQPRKCIACDREFAPKRMGSRVCGKLCREWIRLEGPRQVARAGGFECSLCMSPFFARHLGTRYCSERCRGFAQSRFYVCDCCGVVFVSRFKADCCGLSCSAKMTHERRPCTRSCLVCGVDFSAKADPRNVYCSRACLERRRNKARRAYLNHWNRVRSGKIAEAPVKIDPVSVFARDNWTCWLCHSPVSRTAAAPHPRSATVDHVVPVSKGGSNDAGNLRCAHWSCNVTRNNREPAGITFDPPPDSHPVDRVRKFPRPVAVRPCAVCGTTFVTRSETKTTCSDRCYHKATYKTKASESPSLACKLCGAAFDANDQGRPRVYCSSQCTRRAAKLAARGRRRIDSGQAAEVA